MIGADAKALHHAAAHDAPAQRTHYFPEHHAIRVDLATAFLVTGEQILPRAKPADWLVDLAEPPRIDADPAQILHGIAEMGEFPVKHRAHAVRPDDEIAVA